MPPFVPDIPFHVQAVFALTFSYIWLSAFFNDPDYLQKMPEDADQWTTIMRENTWQALKSAALFMTAFAYLNPYIENVANKWMQRFFRCCLNLALMYMCWLIFMLNMRPDMGRASLGFLDSRLNKKIERGMHTYGEDCALTLARFWDDIDHYYLVHCLDYFALAILFRDPYICHFWSIYYEIIELSAKHRLPHFEECWWDSLLTDIAFSNTPAIILGLIFIDRLGVRRYDWLGRFGKQSVLDWEVFKCHRRFAGNCLPLVLFSFHFLSSFFLMNALLVPPTHPAVACRMLLWAVLGGLGF